MRFAEVPLGQIAELNPSAPKIAADEKVSFLPMADAQDDGSVTVSAFRRYRDVKTGYTGFADKDVLIAKVTPCFENNKIVQASLPTAFGFGSTEFHVARAGDELDPRYLLHFLRQDWVRYAGERRMTGSGGQRRVPKQFLEQLPVPKPPLLEQRRIAAILDQADALRRLRRQSLSRLSDLGQAIFAEMFGNGSDDLLQSVQLTDVALKVTDGEHLTPRRSKSGYRLLSARNVRDGFIDYDNVDYVDELEFQRIAKRCLPREGDVLISCSGSVGRVALVESKEPFVLVRSAALVVPNTSLIDARYLSEYLRTPRMFRLMNKRANSSGQPNLFLNQIKQLPILLPSINRQREFSRRFMALRSNLLPTMTEASHRLNGLFASLQHRAFRGEL